MTATDMRRPRFRVAAAVLFGLMLAVNAWTIVILSDRNPEMDETEYMHAGWLMANGGKLYETFLEHHSPLFLGALSLLADHGEGVAAQPFYVRARLLAGACGLIALAAFGLTLWRAGAESAAIAVAVLYASGPIWTRGFAEIRGEVFALAFYWCGALLIARSRGVTGGVGVGLVAAASLWNAKWPFASIAIGLFWLLRTERRVAPFFAAVATTAAGFAAVRLVVPFDLWWFFNFDLNVALRKVTSTPAVLAAHFGKGAAFHYVPNAFHPWVVVPAAAIIAASLRFERSGTRALPLLLLAGAFLDLRVLYAWPYIYPYYYLMWSIAAAAVFAVTPGASLILLQRARVPERWTRPLFLGGTAFAAVILAVHVWAVAPARSLAGTYWVQQKYFVSRMRPGDVLWLEPPFHPVTVHDAHYYWFGWYAVPHQMIVAANDLRRTPRGRRYLPPPENFPPCNVPPNLRFLTDSSEALPETRPCIERLFRSGRIRKSHIGVDVLEIQLKSAPQ